VVDLRRSGEKGRCGALAHRTVLRVSVARSASIVRKLWTGRPSSVRLVLAFRFG
jgi:hypothetical protein